MDKVIELVEELKKFLLHNNLVDYVRVVNENEFFGERYWVIINNGEEVIINLIFDSSTIEFWGQLEKLNGHIQYEIKSDSELEFNIEVSLDYKDVDRLYQMLLSNQLSPIKLIRKIQL
jgi:hypothetical protein